MAPSAASDSPATLEKAERNLQHKGLITLQPFFVLHKASHCNAERKSTGGVRTGSKTRTRRRIDLTPPQPKSSEGSEAEFDGGDNDDHHDHQLRTDAFNHAWSKIESTIKASP
ncbi:hypothetical protein RHSIM_Rhsim03G0224400 [Rhododendron simsii]|uniref:Uncharacterized protein n=1 Tax=Rhododendron simsii TaxID=118357 RepID=A0A834H772_RHOSS|nr:hypothetical protein RHSIM_Rhsim03G0224400 [Rhododendron simsii]